MRQRRHLAWKDRLLFDNGDAAEEFFNKQPGIYERALEATKRHFKMYDTNVKAARDGWRDSGCNKE